MDWPAVIAVPVLTGGIGWFTNWVAIRMLFRPRRPWRLPFLVIHGLIPKRQDEMARQMADVIERELLGQHQLRQSILALDAESLLQESLRRLIRERLAGKLRKNPLLGAFISDSVLEMVEKMALAGLREELPGMMNLLADKVEKSFPIKEIIERKIAEFDVRQLENIVMQVAKREFVVIERLGAVIGFLVGLVELVWLWWCGSLEF